MPVFTKNARTKADRIAAVVGLGAFAAGMTLIAAGAVSGPTVAPSATIVSSPIPGEPITTTTNSTAPPTSSTKEPRVYQETTTTEGTGNGTVTVTSPGAVDGPWLGSQAADVTFQVMLVTAASLLLAFACRRVLLGEYGMRAAAASDAPPGRGVIGEDEAGRVKQDVAAARETQDLSRPLFERAPVSDPRLRLLQNRITLELEVRKLAQDNDLPSGLTIPFVVKGLVGAKKMSPKLGAAVVALSDVGERLGHGAEVSLDATTLLADAYSQALAKVGGKIR
jgi:hypothetical protein